MLGLNDCMKKEKNNKKTLLVICGPTAVGKSDFADKLAQCVHGEIINMDVGQFYTPLSLGTAKPSWRDKVIPHHLFDRTISYLIKVFSESPILKQNFQMV